MKNNIIGVDLALKVIQVCVYTNKKVQSNTEMTPEQFSAYLSTLTPSAIIFEACAGSNYWSQLANNYGQESADIHRFKPSKIILFTLLKR